MALRRLMSMSSSLAKDNPNYDRPDHLQHNDLPEGMTLVEESRGMEILA